MASRICVVGTGYVGMACAVGFATIGWSVVGCDIQAERVEKLKRSIAPYRELGTEDELRKHIASGSVAFEESLEIAAVNADVIIIAVGTPSGNDGSADLSAIYGAMAQLSRLNIKTYPTIVIRSTVPPGTCDLLANEVRDWAALICAPEFLREGSAVADFLNPDRIVVGADSASAALPYVRLFESLQKPVVFTSRCNAELIKSCSSAFLALKISFANEVANLCDVTGGVADDVLRAIGYDRRIGSEFLSPGIGFGGPCFDKDVRSMNYVALQNNTGSQLFSATLRTNEAQPKRIVSMLEDACGPLDGLEIGVWGLAFKAGTDNVRDSVALIILDELSSRGAKTVVYDPAVHIAQLPPGSRLGSSALEVIEGADALLVLTEWSEFSYINPVHVRDRLRNSVVIDGRNILDADHYREVGFIYQGVGRPTPKDVPISKAATAFV